MVADCVRSLLSPTEGHRHLLESPLEEWLTGYTGHVPSIENWVTVELARRLKQRPGVSHIHINAASSSPAKGKKRRCLGHCKDVQSTLKKRFIRDLSCTKGVGDLSQKLRASDHPKDANREIYPDLTVEFDTPEELLLLELKSGLLGSMEVRADIASVHAINVHPDIFSESAATLAQRPRLTALFVYVGAEILKDLPSGLRSSWPLPHPVRGIVSQCRRRLRGSCSAADSSATHEADTLFIS